MNAQEEDDGNNVYFEPLSHTKLMRIISTLHPVDPETKGRFHFKDRITVQDYNAKISDTCCCYQISQYSKQLSKYLRKRFKTNNGEKMSRPESMADDLSSGSSSSSDEE